VTGEWWKEAKAAFFSSPEVFRRAASDESRADSARFILFWFRFCKTPYTGVRDDCGHCAGFRVWIARIPRLLADVSRYRQRHGCVVVACGSGRNSSTSQADLRGPGQQFVLALETSS
jgi:hypothetical protein